MRGLIIGVSAFVLVSGTQYAFSADKSFRQHGAHEHGSANLNVVVDGGQLLVELESPAANLVGFEHKPGNAEQEKAIADAKATLADGGTMFVTPEAAGCVLAKADVEWSMESDEHHDDHDKHDDHDGHADEEVHSSFHASYVFDCGTPGQLDSIDVAIFKAFPGTEKIAAQVIGPKGQGAVSLDAGASRIDF